MKLTTLRGLLLIVFTVAVLAAVVNVAYAQATGASVDYSWFSWEAFSVYAAVGALGSIIHDVNDGNGLLILPHKVPNSNSYDLGFVTPAIFGAIAGFLAIAAQSVPVLSTLFPDVSTLSYAPGALAAFLAGYLYSKTVQVILATFEKVKVATAAPAAAK